MLRYALNYKGKMITISQYIFFKKHWNFELKSIILSKIDLKNLHRKDNEEKRKYFNL